MDCARNECSHFGLRYRRTGRSGQPVKAGSMGSALLAVGKGITHLGGKDPRKISDGSKKTIPFYVSVSFGSWKVLEAKRVVICIGLWGLEDLCLDGLFCVRWVLLGGVT